MVKQKEFHVTILSIFPDMFPGTLGFSIPKKALEKGLWSYQTVNIRDFGIGIHKRVDDPQCAGLGGMVMRADVLSNAIDAHLAKGDDIFYLSPRGRKVSQSVIEEIVRSNRIMLICGRFEGVDERVLEEYNVKELSIGDFILSGGEVAAMALLEACVRILPGVLTDHRVVDDDSFGKGISGMLEYPLYTKPRTWKNKSVPEVLVSGNHEAVFRWKKQKSFEITNLKRPDLILEEK
jgi:tRNA (guanine37-N1)-methyltransferase